MNEHDDMGFRPFPKIARLYRDIVVTEKIDGTNASIIVGENGEFATASRNRLITPEDDNFGFATWAYANRDHLAGTLGPGRHFGEWWGKGIQRGYGMAYKVFSLFNTSRWEGLHEDQLRCVPVLYKGAFDEQIIKHALHMLLGSGSQASPRFMSPEGVVVYHTQGNHLYKITLDGDGHKGAKA